MLLPPVRIADHSSPRDRSGATPFADGWLPAEKDRHHLPIAGLAGAAPVGLCREDGY
jgi:hypothetical protein